MDYEGVVEVTGHLCTPWGTMGTTSLSVFLASAHEMPMEGISNEKPFFFIYYIINHKGKVW